MALRFSIKEHAYYPFVIITKTHPHQKGSSIMAKIIIIILGTLAIADVMAEPPPLGQQYFPAEQRSQPPNTYGTPAEFDRSLSAGSVYGVPPNEYATPNDISAQPDTLSTTIRSGTSSTISNKYGTPDASSSALVPSSQAGTPEGFRRFSSFTPSQYNAPTGSSRFTGSNSLSGQHGAPASSSSFAGSSSQSNQFGATSGSISNKYDVPATPRRFGSISSQYEAPTPNRNSISTSQFGASASSAQFGEPGSSGSSGSLSTQHDTPPAQTNQFGSFSSSAQYGVPASNYVSSSSSSSISPQYGAPSSTNRFSNKNSLHAPGEGYSASRGSYSAQEDALSEPANYQYSYEVQDVESGNQFSQEESRQEETAHGVYRVLLPDGRLQIVEYQADLNGYKPQIRYEITGAGGYGRGPQREQNQRPY